MKKVLALILAAIMLIAVVGCTTQESGDAVTDQPYQFASPQKPAATQAPKPEPMPAEKGDSSIYMSQLEDMLTKNEKLIEANIDKFSEMCDNVALSSYQRFENNEQMLWDWFSDTETTSYSYFSVFYDDAKNVLSSIASESSNNSYSYAEFAEDAIESFKTYIFEYMLDNYHYYIDENYQRTYSRSFETMTNEGCENQDLEQWTRVTTKINENWTASYNKVFGMYDEAYADLTQMCESVNNEFAKDNFAIQPILDSYTFDYSFVETDTNDIKSEQPESPEETQAPADGIRPEFKEAMDSYEAFFDEYIEFMKEFSEGGDVLSMMDDYTDYMQQYTETMSELEDIKDDELTNEELIYYTEVMNRINKKLLEIAA